MQRNMAPSGSNSSTRRSLFSSVTGFSLSRSTSQSNSNPTIRGNHSYDNTSTQGRPVQNAPFSQPMMRDGSQLSNQSYTSYGSNGVFDYQTGSGHAEFSPISSSMMDSPRQEPLDQPMMRSTSLSMSMSPSVSFQGQSSWQIPVTGSSTISHAMHRQWSDQGPQTTYSPLEIDPRSSAPPPHGQTLPGLRTGAAEAKLINPDSIGDVEKWSDYYDFKASKDGVSHTLKPQYAATVLWPLERVSPREFVLRSNKKTEVFRCYAPGCTSKPFGRKYDLGRHFLRAHSDTNDEPCDYPKCNRTSRKDHLREHYREYHNEDLTKKGEKDLEKWLKNSNRACSALWWRCTSCLKRNKVSKGWKCTWCSTVCEKERVKFRQAKGGQRSSGSSATATTATSSHSKAPTLQRENATMQSAGLHESSQGSSRGGWATQSGSGEDLEIGNYGPGCTNCTGGYIYEDGMMSHCWHCNPAQGSNLTDAQSYEARTGDDHDFTGQGAWATYNGGDAEYDDMDIDNDGKYQREYRY